jgi:hypothetical protein
MDGLTAEQCAQRASPTFAQQPVQSARSGTAALLFSGCPLSIAADNKVRLRLLLDLHADRSARTDGQFTSFGYACSPGQYRVR